MHAYMYCKPPYQTTNVLQPFLLLWPVSEENFWTLWCNGRLTKADTLTIQMGATPSGLTSAHFHHLPCFYRLHALLSPNQQCQSTEGILYITVQYSILYILYCTEGICCAINTQFLPISVDTKFYSTMQLHISTEKSNPKRMERDRQDVWGRQGGTVCQPPKQLQKGNQGDQCLT